MKKSWSFSSLSNFEKCPHSVMFPYRDIDNEFTKRGTDVHNSIEAYINDPTLACPHPAMQPHFDALRDEGVQILVESEWGLDIDWEPAEYKSAWLKVKPDLVVMKDDVIKVVDFKTGKRYGNELKHGSQVQLYLCAAAQYHKDKNIFLSELWYVDHDLVISSQLYNRDRINDMRERWHKRGQVMTRATDFPPKPSKSNCKYCFERDRCEFAFEV